MLSKSSLNQEIHELKAVSSFEALYRFAQEYVTNMNQKGNADKSEFFEMIKYCKENPRKAAPYLGFSKPSEKNDKTIIEWCDIIRNKEDRLMDLGLDDLAYIFACCSHICKAN